MIFLKMKLSCSEQSYETAKSSKLKLIYRASSLYTLYTRIKLLYDVHDGSKLIILVSKTTFTTKFATSKASTYRYRSSNNMYI